jgi:hypothetical protein
MPFCCNMEIDVLKEEIERSWQERNYCPLKWPHYRGKEE